MFFAFPYPFTFDPPAMSAGGPRVINRGWNDRGTRDFHLASNQQAPSSARLLTSFGMDAGAAPRDSVLSVQPVVDYSAYFYSGGVFASALTSGVVEVFVEDVRCVASFPSGFVRLAPHHCAGGPLVVLREPRLVACDAGSDACVHPRSGDSRSKGQLVPGVDRPHRGDSGGGIRRHRRLGRRIPGLPEDPGGRSALLVTAPVAWLRQQPAPIHLKGVRSPANHSMARPTWLRRPASPDALVAMLPERPLWVDPAGLVLRRLR